MVKRKHPYRPGKTRKSRARGDIAPRRAGPRGDAGKDGEKALPAARSRRRRGAHEPYWIYGIHAVLAAYANPARVCHRLLVASDDAEIETAVVQTRDKAPTRPAPEKVERADIDSALMADAAHQGMALLADPLDDLAIEDVIGRMAGDQAAGIAVLDQATDPRNVGAIMRSAAAFGIGAVVMQDRHAPPMTGALCKAASGAAERIAMVRVVNLARAIWALKDAGFWAVGLDPAAKETLGGADLSGRVAFVFGAEGPGLRRLTRETCDQLVKVPVATGTDSLNLSNAAAVAFYEWRR